MRFAPLALLLLIACSEEPRLERLEAGTEVPLILLQQLSAGGSEEGAKVGYLVVEDIRSANGTVLIPRGAVAYGRVNWSRSAGALSKLVNEPPRLAVTIDMTTSIDHRTVMMQATQSGEPLHFSGKSSSPQEAGENIASALKNEDTRRQIERMFQAFEGKSMGDERVIRELAESLGLENTERMAREHSIRDIEPIFRDVLEGRATRIVGAETTLLIDTIAELAGLRFNVGDRIAGIFRGPTIHVYPGTPITAYVAEPIDVEVD